MNNEVKICQNCKYNFTIESEDFDFYKKMGVSAPNLCPMCGIQRLMSIRNERVLYKRKCDKCGNGMLSMYDEHSDYVVYCHECWWGDGWDAEDYQVDYNPTQSFFEQFEALQKKIPREALVILNSQNCDYGNHVRESKNIYFSALVSDSENALYSMWLANGTKDCIACKKAVSCELVGYCTNLTSCYQCIFLEDSSDCSECHFSYDLKGCSNCILSNNLRNKSYYIRNKEYTKEDYVEERKKIITGSYNDTEHIISEFEELKNKAIHRFAQNMRSEHVTGNYLEKCNDCFWAFDCVNNEHVKAVGSMGNVRNTKYGYGIGFQPTEFVYASLVIKGGSNIVFSFNLFNSSNCSWCDSVISSSECIGCVGVKKKSYCILNKQYGKEEYEVIAKRIREEMGTIGFLPPSFSAFAYNETAAQDHYPLTKEDALQKGYRWQENIPMTRGKGTLKWENISDSIHDIDDSILKEIFECRLCSRNYRAVEAELVLHRKLLLPFSRICPQCRMGDSNRKRLPYILWHRQCMCEKGNHGHNGRCSVEFETSYAPERKEIVYCEQCYQQEVI